MAIHDAMNWATMQPGSNKRYEFPPFSDPKHPLTTAEIGIIRSAGFDFVRLTVDPGPFLQFQGAQATATYEILRRHVQMILAANLSVIVDFHPVKQNLDYGPAAFVRGPDTPLFDSYCAMLARTAGILAALHTDRVALELMNEPDLDGTAASDASWQAMEEKAYAGIRTVAPSLMLVLTGGRGGNFDGLTALDPSPFAKDRAVIFTFHYYNPGEFTHQSFAANSRLRFAADIPYPAQARPMSDSAGAIAERTARLDSSLVQRATDTAMALADMVRYHEENFSRSSIHAEFAQVAAWARGHDILSSRIFLGEFGVIRRYGIYEGARDLERARWLRDVREEAAAFGFFWSIWTYRGKGGMGIVANDATENVDELTLRALGMKS